MVSELIDACKNIVHLITDVRQQEKEKKMKVSEVLFEISNILSDTANQINNGEYPHGNCVLMQRLAEKLHLVLDGITEPEDNERLKSILLESSNLEKEYANREDPETIQQLERAGAEFKAMGILLTIV